MLSWFKAAARNQKQANVVQKATKFWCYDDKRGMKAVKYTKAIACLRKEIVFIYPITFFTLI